MNLRTYLLPVALLSLAAGLIPPRAGAQPRQIDTGRSTLTVRVSKAGAFAAFGHDHEISAPLAGGAVDAAARQVDLHVRAGALRVRDPKASEKDREQIQQTMLGPEVLDAARYPDISFRATAAESAGPHAWRLTGQLTLHGRTHPVSVDVREEGGRYSGSAALRQTDFGITPIKVAGGAVRVKDELRIEFQIQLAP